MHARNIGLESEMNPVVVLNCGHNGLSIIRELGRRGVKNIYAFDSMRNIGTFSRYASYVNCPDPLTDESALIEYLIAFGQKQITKPVLFPTNDHWAQAVAHSKNLLAQYYHVWVADAEVVDLLIRKSSFYAWSIKNGYPVPNSWSHDEVLNVPLSSYPIIAKPVSRVEASNCKVQRSNSAERYRNRLVVLHTPEETNTFLNRYHDRSEDYVYQEYIRGLSDCMYTIGIYANRHSEVMGLFMGRKLRGYPPDIGDCMVGQVETVDPLLANIAKEMCRHLRYTGLAEFEFKKEADTGRFVLIEINPRSWSWIGITPYCGVSLPWMAYCDMTGTETIHYQESNKPTGSIKYARVEDDRRHCLYLNKKVGFPEWHMTRRQWRQSLECEKLVDAEYAIDDLRPWIIRRYRQIHRVNLLRILRSGIRRCRLSLHSRH